MGKTLYIRRPLENAQEFIAWAKSQGFPTTQEAKDLHTTIVYSKTEMDRWPDAHDDQIVVRNVFDRKVMPLGDGGAVVLKFNSPAMQARWSEVLALGAKSDFPTFTPHVTVTWKGDGVDLSRVEPYKGPLVFGPEIMREIDEHWQLKAVEKVVVPNDDESEDDFIGRCMSAEKDSFPDQKQRLAVCYSKWRDTKKANTMTYKVIKVDEELGVVFGWGIVSTVDGSPYFDVQGDYIPDNAMLKATTDFMEHFRVGKEMHVGDQVGVLVHSMPLTKEIAKAFGIVCDKTGWMVGYKPYDKKLLAKFKSGELTGFSIGGDRVKDEVVLA